MCLSIHEQTHCTDTHAHTLGKLIDCESGRGRIGSSTSLAEWAWILISVFTGSQVQSKGCAEENIEEVKISTHEERACPGRALSGSAMHLHGPLTSFTSCFLLTLRNSVEKVQTTQ